MNNEDRKPGAAVSGDFTRAVAALGAIIAGAVALPAMLHAQPASRTPASPIKAAEPKPTDGSALVKYRAFAEHPVVPPGGSTTLALHCEIEKGWHLYWRNAGETGGPVAFVLPEVPGLRFGDIHWPTPEWHELPGGILDFTHEGELTLLVPVTVEASATPGSTIKFDIPADWVVCSEFCLFGNGKSSVTIRVGEPSATDDASALSESDAAVLKTARERLPVPASVDSKERPSAKWDRNVLVIHAPGAERVTFFPYETNAVSIENMLDTARVEGETMRLKFDGAVAAEQTFGGVVVVERDGRETAFEIVIPGPQG